MDSQWHATSVYSTFRIYFAVFSNKIMHAYLCMYLLMCVLHVCTCVHVFSHVNVLLHQARDLFNYFTFFYLQGHDNVGNKMPLCVCYSVGNNSKTTHLNISDAYVFFMAEYWDLSIAGETRISFRCCKCELSQHFWSASIPPEYYFNPLNIYNYAANIYFMLILWVFYITFLRINILFLNKTISGYSDVYSLVKRKVV